MQLSLHRHQCILLAGAGGVWLLVFGCWGLCSSVISARQHPLDLLSFRSHQFSHRTHQEDRCIVGVLSASKGEYLGLHKLPANQENKAVPSATASFKRLLHIQANNTVFLQRLKPCLHAQKKALAKLHIMVPYGGSCHNNPLYFLPATRLSTRWVND